MVKGTSVPLRTEGNRKEKEQTEVGGKEGSIYDKSRAKEMGMLFTAALVVRHHPSTEVPRDQGSTDTRHDTTWPCTVQYMTTSPTETGRARHVPHQQNKAVEVQYPQALRHSRMAPFDARSTGQCGLARVLPIPGTGKYKNVQYGARLGPRYPGPAAEREERGETLLLVVSSQLNQAPY